MRATKKEWKEEEEEGAVNRDFNESSSLLPPLETPREDVHTMEGRLTKSLEEEKEKGEEGEGCFLWHHSGFSHEGEEKETNAKERRSRRRGRRRRAMTTSISLILLMISSFSVTVADAAVDNSVDGGGDGDGDTAIRDLFSVVRGTAHLPCNLTAPSATDGPRLVLWYKNGDPQPIYSYDARFTTIKRWSEDLDLRARAEFRCVLSRTVRSRLPIYCQYGTLRLTFDLAKPSKYRYYVGKSFDFGNSF